MPMVEVKKLRGLWRLVEAGTERIARTAENHVPRDGGGRVNAAPVKRQAGYINAAIEAGGSTLRDYRDAFGQPGDAVQAHQVYGRAGLPCLACGAILEGFQLGGRTTVACPCCQDLSTKPRDAIA